MNKNMMVRAASGVVYVGVILACIFAGGDWFNALALVLSVLCVCELQRLLSIKANISMPARVLDLILTLILFAAFWLLLPELLLLSVAYLPLRMILAVIDKSGNPARTMAYSLFSIAYAVVPFILLLLTYQFSNPNCAMEVILVTFILLWLNDTGAYLFGMNFGRTKLCERLSPKKTWEGFWGGFALSIVGGILFGLLFNATGATLLMWGVYAALISVVGTFGDLFESLIKRTVGVKDSGNLIPGHGGILDRVDSLLAVAPIAFLFTIFVF